MMTIAQSGARGAPITFTSYGSGPRAVISANDATTGWVKFAGNVWQLVVAENPGFPDFAGKPGIPVNSPALVTTPNDFYWDGSAFLYV